jgi:hypothetical protein
MYNYVVGESFSSASVKLIMHHVTEVCHIWNFYGPAETTLGTTYHLVDVVSNTTNIPIGMPFANYKCLVIDDYLQSVVVDQEGELLIGGIGLFAGYLGRDDLTEKALVNINNELFYRTGDLVRMDHNGLLHYQGRKDHQIKLHGQRIELGEIERCLLNTSISACIVIKWNDNHLVAYVQSSNIDEKQLREHCQSHLPSHMIPAKFMVLDKLPVNANGKIDRKLLPPPDFSASTPSLTIGYDVFNNPLEKTVHDIWCQVLQCEKQHISAAASFFSIGGHSLLFFELYYRYQVLFGFDTRTLSIAPFLQQPSLLQHAKLLEAIVISDIESSQWHALHINRGKTFFY